MSDQPKKKSFRFILSLVLSLEICLALDYICLCLGHSNSYPVFFSALALVFVFVLLRTKKHRRGAILAALGIPLCAACLLALILGLWRQFKTTADYLDVSSDSSFSGHRVLIFVPHPDDDINLAAGMTEKFLSEGSDVRIVFSTNGDNKGGYTGYHRIYEALEGLRVCGVPEDKAVFLGYGDGYAEESANLYFAGDDEPLISAARFTETYGTDDHGPYAHSLYTRGNYKKDLYSLILEYRPDIIFANDLDSHPEHKLVSLMFEETMGELLQNVPDYRPTVYKGFSYSTAYFGENDFYAENLLSSVNPGSGERSSSRSGYVWSERVRFPVRADMLSRCQSECTVYKALLRHTSQFAFYQAPNIINGDKVFWRRSTGSLSYAARFTSDGADTSCLNDFKLFDISSYEENEASLCGFWKPSDSCPEFTVSFPEPVYLSYVCMYDNPSASDNILYAEIRLDNGEIINTGALDSLGAMTRVEINADNIGSLTVRVTGMEGENAGIGEFEVFSAEQPAPLSFIKLTDSEGNFIYNYYVNHSGEETFSLYEYNCSETLKNCELSCIGDEGCSAVLSGGSIKVRCPVGKSCVVSVSCGENRDSVRFSNPSAFVRYGYLIDKLVENNRYTHIELALYRALKDVYYTFVPVKF